MRAAAGIWFLCIACRFLLLGGGAVSEKVLPVLKMEPRGSMLDQLFWVPEARASEEDGSETLIGVVNPGGDASALDVFAFDESGVVLARSELVDQIPAFGKLRFGLREAFPNQFEEVSWVQIGAEHELWVYVELFLPGAHSAYWANSALETQSFMPHIATDTVNFETVLSSINGTQDGVSTSLLRQPTGDMAAVAGHDLPYGKSARSMTDYFGNDLGQRIWGLLQSSAPAIASMEYFTTLPGRSQMASLGLDHRSGNTLRFLHVAVQTLQFWTGMLYINVSEESTTATETYYSAAGEVLKTHLVEGLDPGQKETLLFDANSQERVPPGTSWVTVTSPRPLVGYELFGTPVSSPDDTFTGLQGTYDSGTVIDYPHFETGANAFTALVAVNVGGEAADITFSAISAAGEILEQTTIDDVGPNIKLAKLIGSGGDRLFSNPTTLERGAWVRATASGSAWAGFLLWGDQGVASRQFLSGITAGLPSFSSPDNVVLEMEDNNGYARAQQLAREESGWNVKLVGSISKSDRGEVVNTGGLDDLEDIYTFTLTQTTTLAIGIAPDQESADLDLFVFGDALPSGDFFAADSSTDPVIDYSANLSGDEMVARTFAPGTYYVLVSLAELSSVDETEYGLCISSGPLLIQTFDGGVIPNGWSTSVMAADSDQIATWEVVAATPSGKYGSSLRCRPATDGQTEASVIRSPLVAVPETGVTLFAANLALVYSLGPIDPALGLGSIDENQNLNVPERPIPAFAPLPIVYEGDNRFWTGWQGWVDWSGGVFEPDRQFYAWTAEKGRSVGLAIVVNNNHDMLHVDNVAVLNIQTSLGFSKRSGQMADLSILRLKRSSTLESGAKKR